MAEQIYSVHETLRSAAHTFYLDRPGRPELVRTGFRRLDDALGGLGPKACGILAGATGVGKSSAMLASVLSNTETRVGVVSMEDGPDVVGTRILSSLTGIDSLRIRRKDLTEQELETLRKASQENKLDHALFSYKIAGTIEDVEDSVRELCNQGCELIWLDYLQKIRGHHNDRRHEVAESFTRFQRAVAKGGSAGLAISQFRRFGAEERVPQIYHLKESGDLENEARLILLGHRFQDEEGITRVRFRVGKSTYGGEWIRWDYVRNPQGVFEEVDPYDVLENF